MIMPNFMLHGHKYFQLTDPEPVLVEDRRGVDSFQVSYQSGNEKTFRPGQVAPGRPGMIIDVCRTTCERPGEAYVHALSCIGNAYGDRPTRRTRRGKQRTLSQGWDIWPESYLSYHHQSKDVIAYSADNSFESIDHGFSDGRKVTFENISGGAPVVSTIGTPTPYWIINASKDRFQVSDTESGGPITLTTNMTAGSVLPYEFTLGATHPKYPFMFVADVRAEDEETDWGTVDLSYQGFISGRVKTRRITVNGQTTTQENFIVLLQGGGWPTGRRTSMDLPKVQVEEIVIQTTPGNFDVVPTSDVTNIAGEVRTDLRDEAILLDPPDIKTFALSGDLTWNWPNRWSLKAKETVDTIPGTTVCIIRRVWEYVWPVTL